MAEKIVERSAISMYKQDMAKYSIVVNRRRAIPAVQDGLKPVQRRSIFAAFRDRLTKPSLKDKSASLVGTTMKYYHPHGDCLRGDTTVLLLNGTWTTLYDLYLAGQPVEILAINPISGEPVPAVAHSFRIGQYTNNVYHIRLSNGHEICCTSNHPFMLPNGEWIKAENIKPYTRLYTDSIRYNGNGRPSIGSRLLQDIVYEYYYGELPDGMVKHHKDFNYLNNTKDNFIPLTKNQHRLEHEKNNRCVFLDGLAKGRERMFSDDSDIRYRIERKNSILMSQFNKEQGIRRFKSAIQILVDRKLPITIENYESLRGEVYNLPKVERLLKKFPEYGSSFEDLINLELKSIGEKYDDIMSDVKNAISFDDNIDTTDHMFTISGPVKTVIDRVIDSGLPYTLDSYKLCINSIYTAEDENISRAMYIYQFEYPYVESVYIEQVQNEPMYDYTVDGWENIILPVGCSIGTPYEGLIGYSVPFISAHNSSIYETIVTLVNWFKTKYPLFYGKGNWGSCAGDGAAASRYTETALSDFGYDVMIDELAQSKNIVDWVDTYKRNGDKEPEYLPAKIPNLLVNGSFGIGVGMSINVPSHNLGEVIDATINLINHPNSKVVLIPDLPQACELIGNNWEEISNTGRGSFKARGVIETVQDKKGNYTLHIRSLPDQVNCTSVYDKILSMVGDKQLPMIKDVFNSLDNNERPDIVIHLKPGADAGYVKQVIYAKTGVQQTVNVNFEAVSSNGIDLKRYSYTEYLKEFIDQRLNIKFRLYCNKLQQAMTRHMHVDAFVKVMTSKQFDQIINMIRKYDGTDDSYIVEYIIKHCNVTDIQAKFIISRTLPQLSKGHLKKYIEERDQLQLEIDSYMPKVTDDGSLIKAEIVEELKAIKKKYNTPRLCTVIDTSHENDIPKGIFKVVITENNYIRKIPDVDKVGIVRKDNPKFILRVDNAENILIFDNKGKVFNLPVHKIPITDKSGVGTDIRILVKNLTSDIISVFYEPIFKKISKSGVKHYLTVLTKSNSIKKLDIEDFLNVAPSGLMYSKIRSEDEVVGVSLVPHNLDIAICSKKKVLRCKLKDIHLYKRNATGDKAMNTTEPLSGLSVFYPDATDVIVVTKNGKFNRFNIAMLNCLSRARKGVKVIKLDATDEILNVFGVNETDKIRLLTSDGIEEIAVADVKVKSTIAAGTKMVQSKGVIVRADVIR